MMKVRNLKYYLGGFVMLTMLLAGGVGYEMETTTEISMRKSALGPASDIYSWPYGAPQVRLSNFKK